MNFSRRLTFLALTLASALSCRAIDFGWPGHGTISFDIPSHWSFSGRQAANVGFGFSGRPNSGSAAVLQITLAELPPGKTFLPADLKLQLQKTVQPHLADSVERIFSPQPLQLAQGSGWFVQLTDASLVGQPPVRDNYKVMRNALLAPDERALVVATMQFDNPVGPEAAEMLAIVSSLRFVRDLTPKTSPLSEHRDNFQFTIPESRMTLFLPSAGLTPSAVRAGGATNSPRYFQLSRATPSLMVSGWLEPAARFRGLREFWAGETAAWKKSGQPAAQNVAFLKVGSWDVIAYELDLPGVTNAHLRVEAVQAGTWLDLHLSTTSNQSAEVCRAELLATLRTFRFEEKL